MIESSNRNRRGVAWSAIERFGVQGSQFVASVILARMLLPADYGLIAMLSIFIVLSTTLVDSGMAQAIIQRQGRTESDLTTALIFNVGISILIYGVIYLCAPYIAAFYRAEELCAIARIYSIVLIINSLGVVQQALITVELDFKRQAIASLMGIFVGGCIAIVMAYRGYGVWALVAQQIASDSIRTIVIWIVARWRPRGRFSWESLRTLSSFGSKIMASGVLHVIYVNLYPLIIGRYFASSQLGLFNRATTIGALPSTSISTIVDRALYPVLCGRQESRAEAVATLYRYLRMVCFGVFPAMVGLAVLAEPVVLTLLGERWIDVAPLLRVIAIAYMWDPIMKFVGSLIKSQGRPADFLRAEILKKISGVAILFATVPLGIEAMTWGLLLYAFADMAIVVLFARRIGEEFSTLELLKGVAPTLLISAVMGGVVYLTQTLMKSWSAPMQLVAGVAIGSIIYMSISFIVGRPESRELLRTISSYLPTKNRKK